MQWLLVVTAWVLLAVALAVVIGLAIRLADRRSTPPQDAHRPGPEQPRRTPPAPVGRRRRGRPRRHTAHPRG